MITRLLKVITRSRTLFHFFCFLFFASYHDVKWTNAQSVHNFAQKRKKKKIYIYFYMSISFDDVYMVSAHLGGPVVSAFSCSG